jgi:hypothetical protein
VLQSNSENQNYSQPAQRAVVERMKQMKGRIKKEKGKEDKSRSEKYRKNKIRRQTKHTVQVIM